ncbi:MAG TPA: HD domain-containing phosphohydrolase [Acetobacterium sp.]
MGDVNGLKLVNDTFGHKDGDKLLIEMVNVLKLVCKDINAVKVGEKLDLEMSEIDELRIVAELHDIGKIGFDQDMLLKPGKLTVEEYEIMKTHSEKGYRIIKASSELQNVALGVLHHHERWDGTGYPMGLKGAEIPLFARIITLVDSYDVMTNDRIYKKRP